MAAEHVEVRVEARGEATVVRVVGVLDALALPDVSRELTDAQRGQVPVVVDLEGVNAELVHAEALALGVESMPLASYYCGGTPRANALLLGFGAVAPPAIRAGVLRLARAIDSAGGEPD